LGHEQPVAVVGQIKPTLESHGIDQSAVHVWLYVFSLAMLKSKEK